MYLPCSTTFIMALLFTVVLIDGKPTYSPASKNIRDHIKDLLDVKGVENEYARFLSFLKIYPPTENMILKVLYDQYFSYETYISDLIDLYTKYYTVDEIMELIKFYSSPLGEKTLQFDHLLNQQMKDLLLTKISDYIFTSVEHGLTITLPEFHS